LRVWRPRTDYKTGPVPVFPPRKCRHWPRLIMSEIIVAGMFVERYWAAYDWQ